MHFAGFEYGMFLGFLEVRACVRVHVFIYTIFVALHVRVRRPRKTNHPLPNPHLNTKTQQVLGVTVFSHLERVANGEAGTRRAPLRSYAATTLCLLGSSSLSNQALNFVNYPIKVRTLPYLLARFPHHPTHIAKPLHIHTHQTKPTNPSKQQNNRWSSAPASSSPPWPSPGF